jgi:hypothetical protein
MVGSPRDKITEAAVIGSSESVGLPDPMWEALEEVCRREGLLLPDLLTGIRRAFDGWPLTDAAESFVANYFQHIVHRHERNTTAMRH